MVSANLLPSDVNPTLPHAVLPTPSVPEPGSIKPDREIVPKGDLNGMVALEGSNHLGLFLKEDPLHETVEKIKTKAHDALNDPLNPLPLMDSIDSLFHLAAWRTQHFGAQIPTRDILQKAQSLIGSTDGKKRLFEVDILGRGPLHEAAAFDEVELLEFLIQWGFDVERGLMSHSESVVATPFLIAAEHGSLRCLKKLIGLGSDPLHCNAFKENALNVAASHNQSHVFPFLLSLGISPFSLDQFGQNAFLHALYHHLGFKLDIHELTPLTEDQGSAGDPENFHPASIPTQMAAYSSSVLSSPSQPSPLQPSLPESSTNNALYEHSPSSLSCFEQLLRQGFKPWKPYPLTGESLLHIVRTQQSSSLGPLSQLVSTESDTAHIASASTELHLLRQVCLHGDAAWSAVDLLLQMGSPVDLQDPLTQDTPLLIAMRSPRPSGALCVRLLESGANPARTNQWGQSVLSLLESSDPGAGSEMPLGHPQTWAVVRSFLEAKAIRDSLKKHAQDHLEERLKKSLPNPLHTLKPLQELLRTNVHFRKTASSTEGDAHESSDATSVAGSTRLLKPSISPLAAVPMLAKLEKGSHLEHSITPTSPLMNLEQLITPLETLSCSGDLMIPSSKSAPPSGSTLVRQSSLQRSVIGVMKPRHSIGEVGEVRTPLLELPIEGLLMSGLQGLRGLRSSEPSSEKNNQASEQGDQIQREPDVSGTPSRTTHALSSLAPLIMKDQKDQKARRGRL